MNKDNLERIQATMDYMEQNLKTELHLQDLSEIAGYSYFHYCQLFQRATGLSVKQYLVCRRLKYAIYEISKGAKNRKWLYCMVLIPMPGFTKPFTGNMA